MKNYLKKAISAVIALALASSIVPASFAANVVLTDVPETADYATAVNALVALNVVNGYEDNTFLPDNKITRAEASKIIVAALNETASAEAMKGATKFSDVEAKHEWATGYINKGVSLGYIQGDNGKFDPDGNVTYAQIVKMMICAMGYEDYAASLAEQYNYTGANWYVPFLQLAADAAVTDGVSAAPNEAVTRAQVAQLVYNAVQAPIVKNTGISYTESGKIVPKIQIQDGEQSDYFKSILTEKFDAYYVEGYVVATQKTTGANLKADEVKFAIAKSEKYAEEAVAPTNDKGEFLKDVKNLTDADKAERWISPVKVNGTDAADYEGTYAAAILVVDEHEDWSLLNFIPSGKNKVTTLNLKDLDDADYSEQADWTEIKTKKGANLKFYAEGAKTSTKYMLQMNEDNDDIAVKVYVNGVEVSGDAIWTYVINGDIGDVELVDTYKTDGFIDTIYVNKYATGIVDGITSAGKITFDGKSGIGSIVLDDEDDTLEYNIYYNGEAITIDDLKKDDVLTIAYDVDAGIKNSKFYDIYVSRDVVTGTLKGRDNDEKAAKVGDTYYTFAKESKYDAFKSAKLNDEYTLYLDAFGRVYDYEQNTSAANWAIVKKFKKAELDDDYQLSLFTADGVEKTYYFDANTATVTIDGVDYTKGSDDGNGDEIGATGLNNKVKAAVYEDGEVKAVQNLVVQYKVKSSTGKINSLKFMAVEESNDGAQTEYSERKNAIGSIKLGAATKLVDAIKYSTESILETSTYESLIDEVKYLAYAYGGKLESAYPFVLITKGQAAYTAATRVAIVTDDEITEETDDETGDVVYSINAMYGDEKKLVASDDVTVKKTDGTVDTDGLDALKKGDVIAFKTNTAGQIYAIDILFSFDGKIPSQADLAKNSLVANNTDYSNLTDISISQFKGGNFSEDFTDDWDDGDRDLIKVVYGPVIEKTDADIAFGKVDENGETNIDKDVTIFDFSDDIRVYTYDYSEGEKFRFAYQDKAYSVIPETYVNLGDDEVVIDWNEEDEGDLVNQESVTFAFAIVVDDEVQDIFAFLAE